MKKGVKTARKQRSGGSGGGGMAANAIKRSGGNGAGEMPPYSAIGSAIGVNMPSAVIG